jgi:hypothetical protein
VFFNKKEELLNPMLLNTILRVYFFVHYFFIYTYFYSHIFYVAFFKRPPREEAVFLGRVCAMGGAGEAKFSVVSSYSHVCAPLAMDGDASVTCIDTIGSSSESPKLKEVLETLRVGISSSGDGGRMTRRDN